MGLASPSRLLPLVLALALGGCQALGLSALKTDKELSFAQVQSVSVGLTSSQVRDAFGEPSRATRRPDGTFERMEYPALDAKGNKHRLALDFDATDRVAKKTFTGPIERP